MPAPGPVPIPAPGGLDEVVRLRDTEQIITALNGSIDLEGSLDQRIEFLLRQLQRLLERDARCALAVLAELDRQPSPRVMRRFVVKPQNDPYPVRDLGTAQDMWDDAAPLTRIIVPRVLARLRTPLTVVCSDDAADLAWFEDIMLSEHLKPYGACDFMTSAWAASPESGIVMTCFRRQSDRPFDQRDRVLMSLMLRAAAPMVDRHLRQIMVGLGRAELSELERDALPLLLAGESEAEIAQRLNCTRRDVLGLVVHVYQMFGVASRGELMGVLVDEALANMTAADKAHA